MQKVVISDQTTFTENIEKHPEFNPEITLTLAGDIPAGTMRELRKAIRDAEKDGGEIKGNLLKKMLKVAFVDWNLYGQDGKKLPITVDTIDKKLPKSLADWLQQELRDFFSKGSTAT